MSAELPKPTVLSSRPGECEHLGEDERDQTSAPKSRDRVEEKKATAEAHVAFQAPANKTAWWSRAEYAFSMYSSRVMRQGSLLTKYCPRGGKWMIPSRSAFMRILSSRVMIWFRPREYPGASCNGSKQGHGQTIRSYAQCDRKDVVRGQRGKAFRISIADHEAGSIRGAKRRNRGVGPPRCLR